MASILNVPVPTSAPSQKSIDVSDLFLTRFTPPWSRPASLPANAWRAWVLNQPVAVVCRETLIANLLSLDWKITPRNSKYKEELEPTIRYYTKLLQNGGEYPGLGLDFSGVVEWVIGDLLDTPFGGAAEIGRKGNTENGRVQWIRPIDAGTLYPTLNQDFPIVQYYPTYKTDVVVFKPWEIARTYISPHSFILREGWGMPPPEKVYFALDLLTKGDKYYANLLLDIPTAGILDLGDMEKSSAEEWITAFKSFVNDNTTAFKIPVLYEHNNKVEFIPFGKVPNDIMFNHITLKYAALVAAAYGMSLSDIGLQTASASGETLAGSIRQERRTRKTGHARIKAKAKSFFDQILPDTVEFNWIDYDDELNVAMGRARLASSQAFTTWMNDGVLSPLEVRQQIIQDGLMSVSIPDEIPPEAKPMTPAERTIRYIGKDDKPPGTPGNKEPELIKDPKPPSGGGEGDIKRSYTFNPKPRVIAKLVTDLVNQTVPRIIELKSLYAEDDWGIAKSLINESMFEQDDFGFQQVVRSILGDKRLVAVQLDESLKGLNIRGLDEFLMKAMIYHINDTVFSGVEDYDAMVSEINSKVLRSLDDYVNVYVQDEVRTYLEAKSQAEQEKSLALEEVKREEFQKELSQALKLVSEQKSPVNIYLPETQIHTPVHVSPTIEVDIPKQEAPIVHVSTPEQLPPIVNLSVPETSVTVNVPEQEVPIVNVTVPEQKSIVNVNVPEQASPVINVSPTPIEVVNPVTVNVPKPVSEEQSVTRDRYGNIISTETKINYEE